MVPGPHGITPFGTETVDGRDLSLGQALPNRCVGWSNGGCRVVATPAGLRLYCAPKLHERIRMVGNSAVSGALVACCVLSSCGGREILFQTVVEPRAVCGTGFS